MSIFLSHTHADKALVEPIAERLAQAFGRDTVFYDNWSIQPGDGIVDKMNEALGECRFFFFFVSKNSLPSKMVQLEWQNALVKSMKGEARIIPVKLDDCLMPAVLLQTLYIDYSGYGPENAIRQMVDVISGASTYRPGAPAAGFHNVRAHLSQGSGKVTLEFRAHAYMEPHSRYLILLDNEESDLSWAALGEDMFESGFNVDVSMDDGRKVNALLMARNSPTTPGFPFVVELMPAEGKEVKLLGAMRIVSRDQFGGVPILSA